MLLGRFKEPPSSLPTGVGGGPCKGRKPASEGTGQAEACLTRPAINARENSRHKKAPALDYGATALGQNGFLHPVTGLTVTGGL